MTEKWNALTDDERTKALIEEVLKWERARGVYHNEGYLMGCEKSPAGIYWYDFHGQDCIPVKVDDFNPLVRRDDTALIWAALSEAQKLEIRRNICAEWLEPYEGYDRKALDVLAETMLDPLKLSRAIFAVTVGQEEPTDD